MTPPRRHGLGDPTIPWVVLLDVATTATPDRDSAERALRTLADEAGWASPGAGAVATGTRRDLLGALAADSPEVLRVGLHDHGMVLAARHDALDGLAMLTALGRLLDEEVHASPRGVEPATRGGHVAAALLGRAWEVGVRPQARVAATVTSNQPGDAFAVATVDASPRTSDLVVAGARAVARWNRSHGARATRVSVAVGASLAGRTAYELADRSALLRLRAVESLTPQEVREQLVRAPVQPGGRPSGGPSLIATVAGVALRVAAPRLGSTVLVSHLGEVTASGSVGDAAFYPVTGGGSGLSLGGVTIRGRTTLTLRARAARFDDEGLQALMALVVDELR